MFSFFGLTREVYRRPLSALLTCALLLSSLDIIIILHLIEFVKGFLKNIRDYFSYLRYFPTQAFCICSLVVPQVADFHCLQVNFSARGSPLDILIIPHLQEIVNSQNYQSFVREFVQSAYHTQNGARRPCALRSEFQVKIKKPRHEKFGLEIVEEVYFAENRRLHDRSRRPNQWKCLITSCAEYSFSLASNFKI